MGSIVVEKALFQRIISCILMYLAIIYYIFN